ncbi:MAG: aspartate ammonia-lyase [Rhodospirillaceae bacterium]
MADQRFESDLLGGRMLEAGCLYGIHTLRAVENFPLSGRKVHPGLIHAYGLVKLAAIRTIRGLGGWAESPQRIEAADAMERACSELAAGLLDSHVVVDALQGGAGTSLNMNVNEVVANRALILLGAAPGDYHLISPLDDVNRYQSTNDTFPTALRLAAIGGIGRLEACLVRLQESFQNQERRLESVVKVGRTQFQDAVLTTLGREMAAYAEAINRDRWRVYKCVERLRVVNLGGTAIGTGLAAPRRYIFQVVDSLRALSGVGLARAENLVEATQNCDVFVEVSGILKACAVNLVKISGDLRLLSSGPDAGFGEIRLPPRQAGSSIMPGKVNPVIPEAVTQAALLVSAYDQAIASAAGMGSLELNPFLPLIADALLTSIDLLANACDILARLCVDGIEANGERCRRSVEGATASATALLPALGYETAGRIAAESASSGRSIRDIVTSRGLLDAAAFDALISPEAVCRLGSPEVPR